MPVAHTTESRGPAPAGLTGPPVGAWSDEELMLATQQGHAGAFEYLFDRHGSALFSLALRVTRDRGVAEDVAQEVFLLVWRGGSRFRPERGSVRNWLLMITRYRAIDVLRQNAVRARRLDWDAPIEVLADPREQPDAIVALRERAGGVRAALSTLPVEQREVLELAYFVGLTRTEIGNLLGLPVGTVKGRVRLGMSKLRPLVEGVAAA